MNYSIKCYIGYYKNKVLAISKHKEILVNYLENHRRLNKSQYTVEKEYLSDSDIVLKYDDYVISEYNGYFIPNIDQNIIDLHSNSIDQELLSTIEQLKHITTLSSNIKKISEDDINQMINTIKILINIRKKPKLLNKLNKQYQINHSILYSDIDEYLKEIRMYKEMIDMNLTYKNALVE